MTELASYLRIAQYLLIALAVAGFLYAIYRFVWRHLKPLPMPEVQAEGPSINDAGIAGLASGLIAKLTPWSGAWLR